MSQYPQTLEQLREVAREWKSAEQATVLCPVCGQQKLDVLVNSEAQVIDSCCSNCDYDPRIGPTKVQLRNKAESVFGDGQKSEAWLERRSELFLSEQGRHKLLETLIQIDNGLW